MKENKQMVGNLIETVEQELGTRIEEQDGNNNAMLALLGHVALAMQGQPHAPVGASLAAGSLLKDRLSPEYEEKQESLRFAAKMLSLGIDPRMFDK